MADMEWYDYLLITIVIIGGLNWGLVGLFDWNLVEWLFTTLGISGAARIIYSIVGIASVASIWRLYAD